VRVVLVLVVVVSPLAWKKEETERKAKGKEKEGGKRPWLVSGGLSLSTHRNDRAPSTVTWNVSTQGLHQASARDGDVCERRARRGDAKRILELERAASSVVF